MKSPRFGRCEVWLHYLQTPLSNYEPFSLCDDDDAMHVSMCMSVSVWARAHVAWISRPRCYLSKHQGSSLRHNNTDDFTKKKCKRAHLQTSFFEPQPHVFIWIFPPLFILCTRKHLTKHLCPCSKIPNTSNMGGDKQTSWRYQRRTFSFRYAGKQCARHPWNVPRRHWQK